MQILDGINVDSYGCTHPGKVRTENQDHFLIAGLHKVIDVEYTSIPGRYQQRFGSGARALLLLVADGVGGGTAGEEASSLTLDTIVGYVTNSMRCFYKLDHRVQDELMEELIQLVRESDAAVRAKGHIAPDHAGMATTLTMAHILWPRAYVVQIGDSRCYHMRASGIAQVTKDQTIAQELVDSGALAPEDLQQSPFSHVLSQAIGSSGEPNAEISTVQLQRGDTLLLCTDGLTNLVANHEIAARLRSAGSAREVCDGLCAAALDAGGPDNITVVVSRFR